MVLLMKTMLPALAILSVVAAGPALASPKCTTAPQDKWLSETVMKEKIAKMGYKKIRVFQKTGSCYEIYGFTADNKRAEVYFNPVNGAVVEKNIDEF